MKQLTARHLYFFTGAACLLAVMFVFIGTTNVNSDVPTNVRQTISGINLNRTFDFAGEPVPMNDDTRERLDRELSVNAYLQSSTLLNIKRAARYFPEVEKLLKENGIPDDFKYLAIAESGLRNVTSTASAKGYWQFMLPAAREMGLEVSDEVDERMHFEKSTQAACTYIQRLYKRFGNWTNAAAAYNIGPGGLSKYLNEQKETDYYNLHLNEETSRYVFRVIAIKDIMKNPKAYGYYLEPDQVYSPHNNLKEVVVNGTVPDLTSFAKQHNTTYRMLKFYNPWILGNKLTVRAGKSYTLRLPS